MELVWGGFDRAKLDMLILIWIPFSFHESTILFGRHAVLPILGNMLQVVHNIIFALGSVFIACGTTTRYCHIIIETVLSFLGQPQPSSVSSRPRQMILPPKSQPTSSHAAQVQPQPRTFAEAVLQRQRYQSEPVATEIQRIQQRSSSQSCEVPIPYMAPSSEALYGQQYSRPDPPSAKLRRPHSDSAYAQAWGSTHRPEPSSLFHQTAWDPHGQTPGDFSAVSELPKQSQLPVVSLSGIGWGWG